MSRFVGVVPWVLFLVLTSCGTVLEETRPVHRSEENASTVVIRERPGRPHVPVTEAQFREAMRWLLRDVPLLQRSGALPSRLQVVPAVGTSFDQFQLALVNEYRAWCGRRHAPGDCLELLRDGPCLDGTDRYMVAFDIALGARWDGFTEELRGMADPALVRVVLLGAMVSYMALLAFPELATKGVAAALTVALAAWLGVETVWNLVAGWIQMVREADASTTFAQLRMAGERYGRAIGAQTARILVMVVTTAISEGGFVPKLLNLPGAAHASAALVADTGGMRLATVGGVSSVAVAEGVLTVAMAASNDGHGASFQALPRPEQSREPTNLKLKFKEGWTEEQRAAARAKVEALNKVEDKVVVKAPRRAGTRAGAKFRAKGEQVPEGCDVDHCVDLQLNGKDALENLWPLDSSVNRSLGAQIQQAIKELPQGTPVGTITIE